MKKIILTGLFFMVYSSAHAWNNTSSPYTFSGKVGVGVSSPSNKFEVEGDVSIADTGSGPVFLRLWSKDSGGYTRIIYKDFEDDLWITQHSPEGDFLFRYGDVSGTSVMSTINSAGDFSALGDLKSENGVVYFKSAQKLAGDNSSKLVYVSNHSSQSKLTFKESDVLEIGSVFGDNSDGERFGLLDADGQWALQVLNNEEVQIRVDGAEEMVVRAGGVDIPGELTVARIPAQGDVLMGDFTQ